MSEASTPQVAITSLEFSDGTVVRTSRGDVILIVGANNAGKSATLRAIQDKLADAARVNPVVRRLTLEKTGEASDVSAWLQGWALRQPDSTPDDPVYQALGHSAHQRHIHGDWQREGHVLGVLCRWFCHLLSADERLAICNPPANIALTRDNPKHPIHFLLRDDRLETLLSSKFRRAFGVDLIVHRNAGNQVPLHVGERPVPSVGEDRVSMSFVERLEALPALHSQGDGMRSFAGVLLATSVGRESIMLIDEPEAFLHPPQARLLGTTLVQSKDKNRQLFVATHSADVVRGVLDANNPSVRVLRIQRDGSVNAIRLLSNERIKELWTDPLLRYSNILDGLFHESVIVCEADADCRFYSAILDAIAPLRPDEKKRRDVMFTHCGGKARLHVVVRALREVDVPVCAVADFDILSEKEPLKSVSEALNIPWSEIEGDWRLVKTSVDKKKPDLSTAEVKERLASILESVMAPVFPPSVKVEIQSVLKRSSPWAHAKTVGKAFVPSGDPSRACERLLSRLREGGLHVVELGEIEGFLREEGGHGPKWVNAALTRDLLKDPQLESARQFVKRLAT